MTNPESTTMKTIRALVTLITASTVAAACTTAGKTSGEAELKSQGPIPVVQQAGQTMPVVSSKDRKYWLDMRQAKGVLPRIDGALATGEAEAGVDLARTYLAKHPGDARALTALAAALALSKKYDLAAYYAMLAERAQPGNAAALNIKALAVMLQPKARMADFQRAMGYFQQSFAADQTQIAPGLNLGNLYLETGNAKAAVDIFRQTAERCGQCNAALLGLGVAMSRSRDFEGAKTAFEKILDDNPSHAGALYNLALVYKNGYNKPKQAEKLLFTLLNDAKGTDVAMRERAQTVLRVMRGEASQEERIAVADDDAPKAKSGKAKLAPAKGEDSDAQLLMGSSEFEDDGKD
jgi:tetratricopeptide (TPR) repeat protein